LASFSLFVETLPDIAPGAAHGFAQSTCEMKKRNQSWVKAMMTHLPDIPVALNLSLACKFTLLIGRAVSQFAGEYIDDFSGRGGVVIEAAGIGTPHMSN
jgi:hypothetical protein